MKLAQLRALRAGAQLLAGEPGRDAEHVVRRLLAVQTQDLGAGMLSLRARTRGLTIPAVRRAIDERAIVATWANRGTIHLVARDDLPWLVALTGPTQRTAALKRLAQHGYTPAMIDRAVAATVKVLADEGPLKREDLRARVKQAGFPADGQTLYHLLFHASYEGHVVRGPIIGRQHHFARTEDWLGRQAKPPARDAALAELARRYLAGFGPATDADLAYWAGLPLRDARAGLAAIARELTEHEHGLVDLARREPAPEGLPARLLPLWDDLLVGWKDKAALVADDLRPRIFSGGMIGPAAVRSGRVIGRWAQASGRVTVEAFTGSARGFTAEIRDVERFLATRPGSPRSGGRRPTS